METFNIAIPLNPGIGYLGFTNSFFDTITIAPLGGSALTIDTLEMNPVPEPGSLMLLGLGLGAAGMLAWRRRQRIH